MNYDFDPISMTVKENDQGFLILLLELACITGAVYTFMGIVSSVLNYFRVYKAETKNDK
ncbi:hypothetical protein O9G_005625 [Rozella allomycis CSF55]|nr:hypothetical protein O9G_005625 [Rozella allomycis CSF55]|eukprot:EPZ36331.1 hypothetical protein O9G_005625 [Rozella allomycis CSF55]